MLLNELKRGVEREGAHARELLELEARPEMLEIVGRTAQLPEGSEIGASTATFQVPSACFAHTTT